MYILHFLIHFLILVINCLGSVYMRLLTLLLGYLQILPKLSFENPYNPWGVSVFHNILPSKFLSTLLFTLKKQSSPQMHQFNSQTSTVMWYFKTMVAKLFMSIKRVRRTMWQQLMLVSKNEKHRRKTTKSTTFKQAGPDCFHCAHTRESESRSLQLWRD